MPPPADLVEELVGTDPGSGAFSDGAGGRASRGIAWAEHLGDLRLDGWSLKETTGAIIGLKQSIDLAAEFKVAGARSVQKGPASFRVLYFRSLVEYRLHAKLSAAHGPSPRPQVK